METINPLYPATLIATNQNSPGASCSKWILPDGISKKAINGFMMRKLKNIEISIE